MVQGVEAVEVDIDGRTFWVRPVGPGYWNQATWWPKDWRYRWTSPYPWAVEFFFGNVELSLELWAVIAGLSGFDDY